MRITPMDLKLMDREQELSELSKTVCENFVSFSKN
jgi:hypothetical protein